MPRFDNQRRCLTGRENLSSLLIVYSVSLELVLCKYASISLARGSMTLLKALVPLVQQQWCVPEPSVPAFLLRWRARGSFLLRSHTSRAWFKGAQLQLRELERVHLGLLSSLKPPMCGLDSGPCWACSACWAPHDYNQGSGAEGEISVRWFFADCSVTDTLCHGKWQNQHAKPQGGSIQNNVQNLLK